MLGAVVLFSKNSLRGNVTICKLPQFLYIFRSNWSIMLFTTFQCIHHLLVHFFPFASKANDFTPSVVSVSSFFIYLTSLLSSLIILSIFSPSPLKFLQCFFTYSFFLRIVCLKLVSAIF